MLPKVACSWICLHLLRLRWLFHKETHASQCSIQERQEKTPVSPICRREKPTQTSCKALLVPFVMPTTSTEQTSSGTQKAELLKSEKSLGRPEVNTVKPAPCIRWNCVQDTLHCFRSNSALLRSISFYACGMIEASPKAATKTVARLIVSTLLQDPSRRL